VCAKNGNTYTNDQWARCDLLTSKEWWPCSDVCDYGGKFMYRGETLDGALTATDFGVTDQIPPPPTGEVFYIENPESCFPTIQGPPIVMDIYTYYDNDGANWNTTFNPSNTTAQLYTVTCKTPTSSGCMFEKGCYVDNDPSTNACNNLYYLAAIGPVGTTYTIGVNTENGVNPCNTNPPIDINVPATLSNQSLGANAFTVANGAYAQCYSGTRAYTGSEKVYSFTLTKPSSVSITLNSSADMGLFLYSFICGQNCLDYVENSAFSNTVTLNAILNDGIYHIVVDKSTAGAATFSLSVSAVAFSPFYDLGSIGSCPTSSGQSHTVRIQAGSFNFSTQDQIHFVFWDDDNTLKGNTTLSQNWNGSAYQDFVIPRDDPNDGAVKCSYTPDVDTFIIYLVQSENGKRVFRKLKPTYRAANGTPGLNATKTFTIGGSSIIDVFEEEPVVSFGAQTLEINAPVDAGNNLLTFASNGPWAVEEIPSSSWLALNKTSSEGAENITVSYMGNTSSEAPRSAVLKFYSTEFPGLYRQFVTVQQRGVCNPNPALSIPAVAPICGGSPTTLTAQVGTGLDEIFNYIWSPGGATTQSITVNPNNSTTYSVTISNKYCPVTKTATQTVIVNTAPSAPTNPNNPMVCEGLPNPALTVNVPTGQTVSWYDQSSGGSPAGPDGPSFTPSNTAPGTYTYYAQANNAGCSSATRRAVTLTIKPKPTLSFGTPTCSTNLQNYSVVVTTNGTSLTGNAGTQSGNTFSNIPKTTNLIVTATGSNACTNQMTLTAPACPCPTLAQPTSGGNQTICRGQAIQPLTVTTSTGSANWYNSAGTQIASNTLRYTPPDEGTFSVETYDPVNGCVSAQKINVTLTINPSPSITVTTKACAPNLATYNVTATVSNGATLTASAGSVAGGSGIYTVTGIPAGQTVVLTATFSATDCSFSQDEIAPNCACPPLDPPDSDGNRTTCSNETFPALSVTVGLNETANWYDSQNNPVLPNNTAYTPTVAGIYRAERVSTISGCKSQLKTEVELIVHPAPTLTIGAKACAPDLDSYQVAFSSTGDQFFVNSGTVSGSGNNRMVSDIPPGTNLTITAEIAATGCSTQQTVVAEQCPCPSIGKPVSGGNKIVCQNQPIPALTATVEPGETIDWYNTAGVKLAEDHLEFTPTMSGTYFAEAQNTTNDCVSSERTAITLTINDLPTLNIGTKTCAPNLLTYSMNVNTSLMATLQATLGNVSGSNGVFTISGIPAGQGLTLTVTDPNTCANAVVADAFSCNCPTVQKPTSEGDQTICEGVTIQPLSVTVGSGETANWYNSFGSEVASGIIQYTPTEEGTYFVETENTVNGCTSAERTAVTLTINPRPYITLLDTVCTFNRQQFSATFETNGNNVTALPYDLVINGNGSYTTSNINLGATAVVTARFNATNCQTQLSIFKEECPCPIVPQPTSLGDKTICENATQLPTLSVMVGFGETADWYAQPSGGTPLSQYNGIGATTFQPPFPGTFYAQTRNNAIGCASQARTAVSLIVNELPDVNAGTYTAICANQPIQLAGSIVGATGGEWSAIPSGGTFLPNNGFGSAQTYTPPSGVSSVTLTLLSSDPEGPCPAVSAPADLSFLPLPSLALNTTNCSPDLLTYNVQFSTNGAPTVNVGNLSGPAAGVYTVSNIPKTTNLEIQVSSANGCSAQLVIPAPPCNCPPNIAQPTSGGDKQVCAGLPLPSLSVTVPQGYTARWYTQSAGGLPIGPNTLIFNPSADGTYYVETFDAATECASATRTAVTLTTLNTPAANAGNDQTICFGSLATLTSGNTEVIYLWSNGQTSQSIQVSPSDTTEYTLVVTNADGCSSTDLVVVNPRREILGNIALLNALQCFGANNGALGFSASGGTPPFSLTWSTGSTFPQINGLSAGSYFAVATDFAGCKDTTYYTLGQPTALIINDVSVQDVLPGQFTGSVEVFPLGGTPPYTYLWAQDNIILSGQNQALLGSLGVGSYSVTVADANSCFTTGGPYSVGLVDTKDPDALSAFVRVFPNPTTGRLFVQFLLPSAADATLHLYDAVGREIAMQRAPNAQQTRVDFDIRNYPSGLYFLKINVENEHITRKIFLARE
jgi:hypothetical protein